MWKLDGTNAALDSADLLVRLDLAQPHAGVKVSSFDLGQANEFGSGVYKQDTLGGEFFCVHLPDAQHQEQVQDSWLRGDDVVAVYPSTSRRTVRPEIYWRHLRFSRRPAVGMELIVSVQTSLLDTSATISVSTQLRVTEVLWLDSPERPLDARRIQPGTELPTVDRRMGTGVFLFRPVSAGVCGAEFSYVEMVFPSDFCCASVQWSDAKAVLHTELFPESLEKGVIRRARLRGLFVPRADDLVTASQLFAEFAASPPPLTT